MKFISKYNIDLKFFIWKLFKIDNIVLKLIAELKGGIEHSKSSLPESKGHELANAHRRRAEMAK